MVVVCRSYATKLVQVRVWVWVWVWVYVHVYARVSLCVCRIQCVRPIGAH